MAVDARPIQDLAAHLARLPGIGAKTAMRLAYHLLKIPDEQARELADAIIGVKERITLCGVCFNLTDVQPCQICADEKRDRSVVCVVEQPPDVVAFEKTGRYRGLFHVLHGALSPLDGVAPDNLRIAELVARVRGGGIGEVVIATNPNREGEATAHFLAEALRDAGVKITRIAHGIPVGSEVEYADSVTLGLALAGRREFQDS